MNEVRDKLVELLEDDRCPMLCVFGDSVGGLADYLIANGVTVQRWIPVTERLPKTSDLVVALTVGNDRIIAAHDKYGWLRYGGYEVERGRRITHWMPLPQAPGKEGV